MVYGVLMNNKYWLILVITFLVSACGGGGGGTSYSSPSSSSNNSSSSNVTNLNSANSCKTAWYTATPSANSENAVFKNYIYFWQTTSFEAMPVCLNNYEDTSAITAIWKDTYVPELIEYSKNTLGQIVPLNVFILGANPPNAAERTIYNRDFATVQSPVAKYNDGLTNYNAFIDDLGNLAEIDSAGGGYSHEAAPNGADIQLPQNKVWGGTFGNEDERIQDSFKIIAHEYFHVYQNSLKFYNESNKTISLPKAWFDNPNLIDNPTVPAYFPWWIEEGGADFGGIVLAAKYANNKGLSSYNPVEQFQEAVTQAHTYFASNPTHTLTNLNLPSNSKPDPAYAAGTTALYYLWHKDSRNFNAAMSKYYTSWQEAELASSGSGWSEAFYDVFYTGSGDDYYTLADFVSEFNSWIRSDPDPNVLIAEIAKTKNQIIHADVIPTTVNTPNAASKTIQVQVDSNPFGLGNRYFIDGVVKKTLVVKAGETYKFNIPNIVAHPFKFSTTDNGIHGGGDEYTTNVTTTGTEVTIVIPATGVSTLYYYCEIHGGMGGKIIVSEQGYSGGIGIGSGEGAGY